MLEAKHKAMSQRLFFLCFLARSYWLAARGSFSHTTATYLMANVLRRNVSLSDTHSSPLEAAEAGTQTVGHSPQGLQAFPSFPADAALGLAM
jgi:hypothetical protein